MSGNLLQFSGLPKNPMKFVYLLFCLAVMAKSLSAASDLNILFQQRDEMNKTIWSDERKAQEHERYFVSLWDDLRAAGLHVAIKDSWSIWAGQVVVLVLALHEHA